MLAKMLSSIVSKPIIGSDRIIEGLALDSRLVKDNYLFLAVKGEQQDGHDYVNQAIQKNATAIALEKGSVITDSDIAYVKFDDLKPEIGNIASRFYDNPTQLMSVIGVTGTNGKTSITHYIAQLFEMVGQACGVIGTLGIEYKNTKLATVNTTPDAITLQKSFYEMLQEGVNNVAMEVSSHALTQYRCSGIRFNAAIMSNVTHDHLDYHQSFEAYLNAKLALFSAPGLRVAIVNADDSSAQKIREVIISKVKLVTYSLSDSSADVYLSGVQASAKGYSAFLHYAGQQYPMRVFLLGEFNLYNVLAAIIAVCEQDYTINQVLSAVEKIKPVPGRMQLVSNRHGIVAVVDYAHTPDALENVLRSLKKQISGRLYVVFGCGGDRDKEKRPKMAAIAEALADFVVVTADNPRNEKLEDILQDIESGFLGKHYQVVPARDQAIALVVGRAMPGDCVLVAGKGHEKTQIIGNIVRHFDDVEVLEQALDGKQVTSC